jgi:hypothetical protein
LRSRGGNGAFRTRTPRRGRDFARMDIMHAPSPLSRHIIRHPITLLALVASPVLATAPGAAQIDGRVRADTASVGSPTVPDPRGSSLIPLPILFRGPETGTGFGGAATYLFRSSPATIDEVTGWSDPSSITAVAIHTSRKQLVISIEPVLRLQGDRLRIAGGMEYVKFPSTFWGIGNDTDDALEEDYTPQAVNLEGQALWEIRPGWYWGLGARFARRWLFDIEPAGLLDRDLVPGSRNGQIVGLGIALTRDTRDRSENPRSGTYHQLEVGSFASLLGSDFEFTTTSLDLRGYLPFPPSSVLALRILGESVRGTVPFDVLPQLGGDELLRGYYRGRYRDQNLLAAQAEVRSEVWWRFGLVGFAALGQVAPSPSRLRLDGMKASLGGGLRFALNKAEGLNLRADYAWGLEKGTRAFYLSLGEVF